MSDYFTNYPLVQYQNKDVRDISKRSKIQDSILNDPFIFLPFTVREGEKPEDIARFYYGSVDDTWLVLFANNITDPYYDWPLDDNEFDEHFIEKYSEISGKSGFDVIRWAQDETRDDNVVYYYRESNKDVDFIPSTFSTGSQVFVDVSEEQIQEILDEKIVTIDGIQYKLVKEE